MKELGKALKEKRLEKKATHETVRKFTKIQEKFLIAIEEGDESAFPADVFYKSYVRSYAKFLDINADDLIKEYNERKAEKEAKKQTESESEHNKKEKRKDNLKKSLKNSFDIKKIIITVGIAIFLLALFLYLNNNINNIVDDNSNVVKVEKSKDKNANKNIVAAENNDAVNETQVQINKKQLLEVEALDNVWVKIDADKKEVFQGTILKGRKKSWQADDTFTLRIGYTPGIKVFFNNNPVDVRSGSVQDVNTITLRK